MISHTTRLFRDELASLPKNIQARARAAYRRFRKNPGSVQGDDIVWFWIGKHEEYERLLKQL
jgi:hypothetical protein